MNRASAYKRFCSIFFMHITMVPVFFSVTFIRAKAPMHGEAKGNIATGIDLRIPDSTGFGKDETMISVQCSGENNGFEIIDELTDYLKLNMIRYQYMSLPFPASWPIKGKPTAYFFGFKGIGLNTGIPAHDLVVSPSAVVMECESDSRINLSLKTMGSITLGKESSRIPELKDTVFAAAVDVFYRIIACNERRKEAIDELRKVYQAWMSTFPKRCDFIKKYSPAFIDWLLDKNAGANIDLTNDPPRYLKRKGIVVE